MKSRWLYLSVGVVAIFVVTYPLGYAYFTNQQLSGPYLCAPLIPCQGPSPGLGTCHTVCTVLIANASFYPGTMVVSRGATIAWDNKDGVTHTATPFNNSAWPSPLIKPGSSFTWKVPLGLAPGDYYYHCNIHPAMIAIIRVVA